ncbi:hypothetical protein M513_03750, partial [Trichuris suis]
MLLLLYLIQVISLLNGDYQTAVDLLISRIYRNSRKGHGLSQGDKAETTKISMKVHVRHIAEINEESNVLRLQLFLEMVWYDANIGWKLEDYENVKVVTVQSPYLWMPQLRILNSVNDSLVSYGGGIPVKVWSAGYVYTSPEVMISIDCSMEASNYPTDEHECPILLAPTGKDTESVSLGISANPELNLYWPSSGKKEGKKLSVGQWETINVTQAEETYNLQEESWKGFAIGKNGTDIQVLKVTVRFRRRIPHFRHTVVLPAAVAATLNTVAMYPSGNFLLTLMLLFPNLLLQCVLTAYLLKDMPIATAEVPRITKFHLVSMTCTAVGIATTVVLLWIHESRRKRQSPVDQANSTNDTTWRSIFLKERRENIDCLFASQWLLFATFVIVQ